MCEELHCLVDLYTALQVRKTRSGPPEKGTADDVWAVDASWIDDPKRKKEIAELLAKQGKPLRKFWYDDYETKASKYWNEFYRRNEDRFFKDRHYIDVEFRIDLSSRNVLELGSGVGNGGMPLKAGKLTCVDFAPKAIELLKQRPDFDPKRCAALVADIVKDDLPTGFDVVTCFFVLSALAPSTMPIVAKNIATALRSDADVSVLVRDYGRYDEAQLRFQKSHKLSDDFYVKSDGTRCFYFDLSDLDALFHPLGFHGFASFRFQVHRNRATGRHRRRVFIQALYHRPPLSSS